MSEEKQYHQYFSSRPVINITTTTGERIRFVGGIYVTDKAHEIEFLDGQIKAGHPLLSIKKGSETITSAELDPLAAVKKRAIEEYLAQKEINSNPNRDMGNTAATGGGTDIATTKTIAPITVGSRTK